MNRIRRIAAVLAGLAATVAVFAATGPAAFAMQRPSSGSVSAVTPSSTQLLFLPRSTP